jgi:flagellar protein FliO/FliZ
MAETSAITRAAQGLQPDSVLGSTGASAIGQTLLWLIVVVGLILVLAWLAKRLGGANFQNAAGMKMLSVLAVGNKEKIALVQVGEKQLLIGIAPGSVRTLHVFDESVNTLLTQQKASVTEHPDASSPDSQTQTFQQILVKSLTRKKS